MAYQQKEKVNNELVVQSQKNLANLANANRGYLEKQLPPDKITDLVQDVRMAIAKSVGMNKGSSLADCTTESILACMINAYRSGVSLNPDQKRAYLVPYRNGNHYIAQLNISYMGMRDLVTRDTGIIMRAECVYSHEPLEYYSNGFEQIYKHTFLPVETRGDLLYAFSMAKLPDGQVLYERMTKDEIDKCKKASKGSDSPYSPWVVWEPSMWLKSVSRRQCKNMPNISNATAQAIANDEALAIGRPQDLTDAYKDAGITVEPPKSRTDEENSSAFDDIFSTAEPVAEPQQQQPTEEAK